MRQSNNVGMFEVATRTKLRFPSTKADDIVVRVRQGKRQRLFKIHVGP